MALDGELDTHLPYGDAANRNNGLGKKRVRSTRGKVVIATALDRKSTF